MILHHTQVRVVSDSIGEGAFAGEAIPRGTIVWTQDVFDQVWSPSAVDALPAAQRAVLERWAHVDQAKNYILCWDAGRLVNHSCEPTLRGIGPWFQVARRDIQPGEQLTCDYGECNIDPGLDCECGHPSCRGRIHSSDLMRFGEAWDREAAELLRLVGRVPQPLQDFLLDPAQLQAWQQGHESVPSFRSVCAFPNPENLSAKTQQ
ncbi:MAG: hypothetical protein RJA70_165 [Pseudomonadota bacterium]|jgi:hypothetical protein